MSSPDVPWKHRWLFIHVCKVSPNIFDDRALKPWDTSKEGDPYVKAGTPTSIFASELLENPPDVLVVSDFTISTRIIPTNGRIRQWLITILTRSRLACGTPWKKFGFLSASQVLQVEETSKFQWTWWNSRSSSLIRNTCNVLNTRITLGYPKSQRLFF